MGVTYLFRLFYLALSLLVLAGLTLASTEQPTVDQSLVEQSIVEQSTVKQPEGYRVAEYDDAVPDGLDGAELVDAIAVKAFLDNQTAVVIDVLPQQRRPDFLPENQIWIPVSHKGLPGSLWLPDIGYGVLSEVTEGYFKRHLRLATNDNLDHPVVFYCRMDCWMSWNAAKRALGYGYRQVKWFAEGTDGWFFEGWEFETLMPAEGVRQ